MVELPVWRFAGCSSKCHNESFVVTMESYGQYQAYFPGKPDFTTIMPSLVSGLLEILGMIA